MSQLGSLHGTPVFHCTTHSSPWKNHSLKNAKFHRWSNLLYLSLQVRNMVLHGTVGLLGLTGLTGVVRLEIEHAGMLPIGIPLDFEVLVNGRLVMNGRRLYSLRLDRFENWYHNLDFLLV